VAVHRIHHLPSAVGGVDRGEPATGATRASSRGRQYSNLSHTTVHEQLYAGDVGAVIGSEEDRSPAQIVCRANPAERNRGDGRKFLLISHQIGEPEGRDVPGAQHVSGFGPAKCRMMAVANAPLDVIGTGSYFPELWSETYAIADIIAYDGKSMVKAGREFLLRNRVEGRAPLLPDDKSRSSS
jgi:hypothetical protein